MRTDKCIPRDLPHTLSQPSEPFHIHIFKTCQTFIQSISKHADHVFFLFTTHCEIILQNSLIVPPVRRVLLATSVLNFRVTRWIWEAANAFVRPIRPLKKNHHPHVALPYATHAYTHVLRVIPIGTCMIRGSWAVFQYGFRNLCKEYDVRDTCWVWIWWPKSIFSYNFMGNTHWGCVTP